MSDLVASIIINNYNYGRFLGEAIDSALAQTYPHTEVIVVDDGSTDNSREVIATYGKRIVSIIKPNGGQGSTYNAGFYRSRGDFVYFLDADDALFPQALEKASEFFRINNTVKVQWPLKLVDEQGHWHGKLSTFKPPPDGELQDLIMEVGPLYDWYYTTGNSYARWFLQKIMPVPEQHYRNGADLYVHTLAPVYGRIITSQESMAIYRLHGKNNYHGRRLTDNWLKECIRRFETNADILAQHLTKIGLVADQNRWRHRNFNYLWPSRLLAAKRDLAALIPEGSKYILIDGGELADEPVIPGRQAVPMIERDGKYYGLPATDADAISELQRSRQNGATFVVFWWTSFWWFEHYRPVLDYLIRHHTRIWYSDSVVVFDLATFAIPDAVTHTFEIAN